MISRKDLGNEFVAIPNGGESAGPRFWRSLEELSNTPEFREMVEREFPSQASVWPATLDRRRFLTLMGASLALAGINGCSVKPAPPTQIVPYVRSPEEIIPGKPLFYATAMALDGGAVGLLVETHMGRPTKIEGNPDHPASLGATNAIHQASVLSLYDPDRSQTVRHHGQTRTWENAIFAIRRLTQQQRDRRGAGLRLLTETITSPTLRAQIDSLLEQFPEAKWHCYEPLHRDAEYEGAMMAFGEAVTPRYDLTRAEVVLSLDDDFLTSGPGALRYAADFMERRRVRTTKEEAQQATMNRLYVAETGVSCTGAKADHRLTLKSSEIDLLARCIASEIGLEGVRESQDFSFAKWGAVVARDLMAHRGNCLVLAGVRQPAQVHLLAHAMNDRLENVGRTVDYIDSMNAPIRSRVESLRELVEDLQHGSVDVLVILGGNPVYNAPADIPFADAIRKSNTSIHFGLYEDETSRLCHWHLPEAHFLENWSDTRAFDGTSSIVQPVIEPLTQGRSAHEVLAILTESEQLGGREIVRDHWRKVWEQETLADDFETRWQTALHDGIVNGSRAPARTVSLAPSWRENLKINKRTIENEKQTGSFEIVYLPDPSIYDGRFANNGWLQELPKPLTKLTWGNAAIVSPKTAQQLGFSMGDYAHGGEHGGYYMPVVELQIDQRTIEAPLWIAPGHADDTVTVHLGYGRRHAGRVGGTPQESFGFDAYRLRTSKGPWFASGLTIKRLERTELVACTQQHHHMAERSPVRTANLSHYRAEPDFAPAEQGRSPRAEAPLTLYEPYDYGPPKHKWGMTIDLTSCFGCNACVVACQAENNIPVVGKEQVARGREMHWIRIDRYVEGSAERPDAFYFQPLPCMHCENAPCEYVCPVAATVHSAEGLNDMIYNRCVGTRFCSNNCPYKVRRFNFLSYADFESPGRQMQYNPDVTVRSRGVMEKCTYCVQRIRQAEIGSQTAGRPIADGDVLTACQAACPTRAIVFGDMNDPGSQVSGWKDSPRNYSLLEELNTVPRTSYLAELRNPNPEMETVRDG